MLFSTSQLAAQGDGGLVLQPGSLCSRVCAQGIGRPCFPLNGGGAWGTKLRGDGVEEENRSREQGKVLGRAGLSVRQPAPQ